MFIQDTVRYFHYRNRVRRLRTVYKGAERGQKDENSMLMDGEWIWGQL